MSIPSFDLRDPRDVATLMVSRGELNDVVVATSRLLGERELRDSDERALLWAREMLRGVATTSLAAKMPSTTQLNSASTTWSMFRSTADSGRWSDHLTLLADEIDRAVADGLTDESEALLTELRELFSAASRAALRRETRSPADGEPMKWRNLTTA